MWLVQDYTHSTSIPCEGTAAIVLCHATSPEPLGPSGPLGAQVGPFPSTFSPGPWCLSLSIQWLQALNLPESRLGDWVSVQFNPPRAKQVQAMNDVWRFHTSVLLPELQHQPSNRPPSSPVGPFVPSAMNILLHFDNSYSCFRFQVKHDFIQKAFLSTQAMLAHMVVWFFGNLHFFVTLPSLVITCIMSKFHAGGQCLGLSRFSRT